MSNYRNYLFLSYLAIVLSWFTACDDDDNVADQKLKIQLATTGDYGKILVDNKNQSLYFFAGDVTNGSNCNGDCANRWPALTGDVNELEIGAALSKDDFGTVTRGDGQEQITYKGWPLYYFSPEANKILESPGQTLGDGKGNAFYVAKPDYTVMIGRQTLPGADEATVYLVDDRGVSLYDFTNDEENVSNCTGGCAGVWPAFNGLENPIVPSTLNENDFTYFERSDDLGFQLSYLGRPVYYFANDEEIRGSVAGHGGASGKFFLAEPTLE